MKKQNEKIKEEQEETKKCRRKEKGITLIALVVTIIVLLILAGVSIAMLTGEGGILKQAEEAEVQTAHQQVYEMLKLNAMDGYMAQNVDRYKGTLIEYLKDNGYITEKSGVDGYIIDVTKVSGGKKRYGNGTDGLTDVYKLEEATGTSSTSKKYNVKYYGKTADKNVEIGILTDYEENKENIQQGDLIEFTIYSCLDVITLGEPYTFNALYGMTWRDWINSEYSLKEFDKLDPWSKFECQEGDEDDEPYISYSGTRTYVCYWSDEVWIPEGADFECNMTGENVKPDDLIIPGAKYETTFTCFVAGTKVLTPKGMINIEDIKVGNEVWTRNQETSEIEKKKVLKTLEHNYNGNILKIHTQNAEVETTVNHPFYVKDKGWTRADELKEGDLLINNNNMEEKIKEIEVIENNETIKVYNLLVEDNHDYFVGLDCVLVHNKCLKAGTQITIDLDGKTKAIEELKAGDMVLTYNEKTGENELRKVTETFIHKQATDIVTIKFKDGTEIVQNTYHPIYTKEGWKSITGYEGYKILEQTDEVKTEEGWKEIESININLNNEPEDLYTISVEGTDNFYANGSLMHDNEY